MEKRKRIDAVNGEILLPESIIQHIQSFLNGKEAAQTTILSKSWYSAWLTRPNLDLDQRDFWSDLEIHGFWNPRNQITDRFAEFAKKTMGRYEELNLKIESFKLRMETVARDHHSLANELVVNAMKMGVTDLNFQVLHETASFVLTHDVFGSEALVRLFLIGCRIGGVDGKVSCSRLKSLSLRRVYIEGDIIWDIISSCPLIEKLSLSECKCLHKAQGSTSTRMLALSPFVEFGKQNVGLVVDGPINLYVFHKLKFLLLEKVKIDTLFFHDFSSRFPSLEALFVHHCFGYKEIRISSCSLECISFLQKTMLRANFDVPSIQKFKFSGSSLPSVSFETASREWESEIDIKCNSTVNSWFLSLNKFLTNLSLSKIYLSLDVGSVLKKSFDCTKAVHNLPKPIVENMMVNAPSSVCSGLLDGLFWSCRPKFIILHWFPKSCTGGKENNNMLEFFCKRLIQEVSENCCIPNKSMFGQCDLEAVNLEHFAETVAEWQPLTWKTLLDASTSPKDKLIIGFQLRWARQPNTLK